MPALRIFRSGSVVEARLCRAERANALSEEAIEELLALVAASGADGTSLLVLRGEGRHFCAGFDLSDLDRETDASLLWRMVRVETLLQALHHAPFLTLALAHGSVVGAGVDLLCACSRRIAGPGATFRMPGWRFGVALGTRRLVARVGSDAARSVLLATRRFDLDEAIRIGLVEEAVAPSAWDAKIEEAAAVAAALDAVSRIEVLRLTLPDTRADDMAALVATAARPGLRDRIAAFRQGHAAERRA